MKPGDIYQHYKGKEYKIIGLGNHSETLQKVVVYQGLYTDSQFGKNPIWVRPYEMFLEEIIVEDRKISRFKKM